MDEGGPDCQPPQDRGEYPLPYPPWVRVPHLASYLLGQTAKRVSSDWERIYRHPIVWLETLVDPARGFKGTCYKAANWKHLGLTTGRGKNDQTGEAEPESQTRLRLSRCKGLQKGPLWIRMRPYDTKEVGEGHVSGILTAIANAVYDATGVRVKELPIYPYKIVEALEKKE